ncbi:MAG: alpha/beta hydrolase [Candidatus Binatia bacterium]|nr:alpha/beta hydrolase [Candidatus Binatia bacterium]MDG2008841.1 alpha/beta hydrolase [Candidatus Binatia bacterium]
MRPPWDGHRLWEAAETVRSAGLGMERRFFGATMAAVDIGSLAVLETRGFGSRMVPTSVGDLHVLEVPGTGKLPPVVVLHGLGSCAADYAGLMEALRRHVRGIIAPDLFGHGLSPVPAAGMHAELLATGLEEGLRAVLQEPSVLLGNSMGGLEAVRLATRMPELTRGLFLASPGGAPAAGAELDSLLSTFAIGTRREALDFVDHFLGREHALRPVLAFGVAARMASPALRELLENVRADDMLSAEEVRSVACPTFLFWGAQDRVLPRYQRDFFLRNLPADMKFASPAGYGHAPHMDDLGGFAKTVLRFLHTLPREPARTSG